MARKAVGTAPSGTSDLVTKSYVDGQVLATPNAQTASYTLALTDANHAVDVTSASATNVTVPPNSTIAFPIGTVIEVAQLGAGQVTIVAGAGVTIQSAGTLVKTRAQYSAVSLRKRATDTWLLAGDLA